jgi:hypothetical protein
MIRDVKNTIALQNKAAKDTKHASYPNHLDRLIYGNETKVITKLSA